MQIQDIHISDKKIGGDRTFVIAEVGSNHNQSLDLAFEHIDAAISAGADAVKFQSLKAEELYYKPSQEIVELHKKIDMEESWCEQLKSYCDKKDITFFSSPCYMSSIDLLESINVSLYKLASAQIGTFPQIVEAVAKLNKPTILSTGIVSYSELEKIMRIFKQHNNEKAIILHCNSIYPTPYEKVNLKMMDIYQQMFGVHTGFSDHTPDIFIPIAAVARGAKVIEKHFALSRELPVPDAPFSLEPKEFEKMVQGIRATEKALITDQRIQIQAEEDKFKESILYRLILKTAKKKGDTFSHEDFDFKRHPTGVDCRQMDSVLLKTVAKDNLDSGHLLSWTDLEFK